MTEPDPIPNTIHIDREVLFRSVQKWAANDLPRRTWRTKIRRAIRELRA